MNEKEFLQFLESVDDAYLLETERALTRKKAKLGLGRKAASLIAAVLVLTLTVSATYVATHWDERFLKIFKPSEAVMEQTAAGVQNLSVMSQCGDTTLYVEQSLGDETTIYFMLDVMLPDDISAAEYAVPNENGDGYIPTIMPWDVRVYDCPASYADVCGMTMDETGSFLENRGAEYGGSIGVQTECVDLQTNTLSYLVEVGMDDEQVDARLKTLTLAFAGLGDYTSNEMILEGPFLISWNVENHGDVCHYDIYEGNRRVGKIMLSGFSLQVSLESSTYTECDALMDDVRIVYRDGRKEAPDGTCAGSIVLPEGRVKLEWRFHEIQVMDQIESVEIAGYTCKMALKNPK